MTMLVLTRVPRLIAAVRDSPAMSLLLWIDLVSTVLVCYLQIAMTDVADII